MTRTHPWLWQGEVLLDEPPWHDPEDDWDLIEHIRQRGALDGTDIEGSVLSTGSWADRHKRWYNPGIYNPPSEKEQARRRKWAEDRNRRSREDENELLFGSKTEPSETNRARLKRELEELERQRKAEEQQIIADAEHEYKKQWAERSSYVERRIVEIVDQVDAGNADRQIMRAMLRYMNLGPGIGKVWDAQEFTLFYTPSRRQDLLFMTLADVERCYDLLKNRYTITA